LNTATKTSRSDNSLETDHARSFNINKPIIALLIQVHFEVGYIFMQTYMYHASGFHIILLHVQYENSKWKSSILFVVILLSELCSCLSEHCHFLPLSDYSVPWATSRRS